MEKKNPLKNVHRQEIRPETTGKSIVEQISAVTKAPKRDHRMRKDGRDEGLPSSRALKELTASAGALHLC